MLKLDFVVFLGDPDEGGSALPSGKVIEKIDEYKGKLNFAEGVYGAITIEKNGKQIAERKPDPVMPLITSIVRTVPFVIDGEPETALLSESEFGFIFEPSGDDILISFFAGDTNEPDELLVEHEGMPLDQFGDQVIGMTERLVTMIKKCDPELLKNDDYSKTLLEFFDMAKSRFKTFRLERERGVRR